MAGADAGIRNVVDEMRDRGEVEVLQKGAVLTGDLGEGLTDVKGPIRVRRVTRLINMCHGHQ
jgi:hypothetical protein